MTVLIINSQLSLFAIQWQEILSSPPEGSTPTFWSKVGLRTTLAADNKSQTDLISQKADWLHLDECAFIIVYLLRSKGVNPGDLRK